MTRSEKTDGFEALRGHAFASLTTFRRNGTPVHTPVWFALEEGRIYVVTTADSGKVKRIRNDPRVLLGPCTARGKTLGPEAGGTARILPAAEWPGPRDALDLKYGWRKRLADVFYGLRRKAPTYLEITPA
jgi:uncharacterized protein